MLSLSQESEERRQVEVKDTEEVMLGHRHSQMLSILGIPSCTDILVLTLPNKALGGKEVKRRVILGNRLSFK